MSKIKEESQEDIQFLTNLKKMIRTANKAAERKNYVHGELELSAIERVMNAQSAYSVPVGVEKIIGKYYERTTGKKPYY